jgi:hypothetical protein
MTSLFRDEATFQRPKLMTVFTKKRRLKEEGTDFYGQGDKLM